MADKGKYIDVTNEWLKRATPNSHEIIIDKKYTDEYGMVHPIANREKVHDVQVNTDEYYKAIRLKEVFGGDIHLVPRITDIANSGLGVRTPDYLWNGEKWDLKTPTTKGKFNNTLERFLKSKGGKSTS